MFVKPESHDEIVPSLASQTEYLAQQEVLAELEKTRVHLVVD